MRTPRAIGPQSARRKARKLARPSTRPPKKGPGRPRAEAFPRNRFP